MTPAVAQPVSSMSGSGGDTAIVDQAAALRARLVSLDRLDKLTNQARLFQTRATELEQAVSALLDWVTVLERFRAHGVPISAPLPPTESIRKLAAQMASDFASDPQSLLAANPMLKKSFWDPLRALPNQLAQALGAAWIAHIESVAPPPQSDLLDALGALPSFREQVWHIRGLYRALDELKRPQALLEAMQGGSDPAAQLDLQIAWSESLPKEIATALATLTGEGIPSNILAFIKLATTPGGASFSQMTPSVHDWFEQHGLVGSLRIRLGTGS